MMMPMTSLQLSIVAGHLDLEQALRPSAYSTPELIPTKPPAKTESLSLL